MKILNGSINYRTLLQYTFIYVMLSAGGMALPAYMGNDNFVIFELFISIYIIFLYPTQRKLLILQQKYLFFVGLFFTSLLLIVLGSTLSVGTSLSVTSILLIIYAAYKIDNENFIIRFLKLIYILAIISLLFFTITKVYGNGIFSSFFPYLHTFYKNDGSIYSYGGWFYQFVFLHEYRNCGPFGEPGKYQCILTVALYFVLFHPHLFEQSKRKKYALVLFLTIITTQSTSGYIALFFIIVSYILHTLNTNVDKTEKKYFLIFTVLIVFLLFTTPIGKEFMHTTIYDKIMGGSQSGNIDFSANTGGARTASINDVLLKIQNDPILLIGVGYDELANMKIEGCAGLLYILLAIGVLPYSILFGFCLTQVIRYNNGIWDIVIRLLLLINMGLGQPHIMNASIFVMLLYPYFQKQITMKRISNVKYNK